MAAKKTPVKFATISMRLKPRAGCNSWRNSVAGAAINKTPHTTAAGARINVMRAVNDSTIKPKQCKKKPMCLKSGGGGTGLSRPISETTTMRVKIKTFKAHTSSVNGYDNSCNVSTGSWIGADSTWRLMALYLLYSWPIGRCFLGELF